PRVGRCGGNNSETGPYQADSNGSTPMTQGNDGLRYTIDRRSGRYFWSLTDLGELHQGKRGFDTPLEAVSDADQYRRKIELGPDVKAKRAAASQLPMLPPGGLRAMRSSADLFAAVSSGSNGLAHHVGCKRLCGAFHSCPLSGVKRTCLFAARMSAFDPKRTS